VTTPPPTPAPVPEPTPVPPERSRLRLRIFRWKAIGPLLLLLAIIAVLVALFAEPIARQATEEASTELLGTEVDVGALDLRPRDAAVELRRIQVADPFDLDHNLVEAETVHVKLNPEALAEKKLVIERLALRGMRFGTARAKPARAVDGNGFAPRTLRAVRTWADQFDVPLLFLTPIDTVRQLLLRPTQLATIREAQALVMRTDSTRQALEQNFRSLDVRPTLDSASALAERLAHTDPKTLGLAGAKDAIASVQQTLRALDDTKRRIETLQHNVTHGVDLLGAGLQAVDSARKQDYAFARSLLKLPSVDAPEMGKAFFGKVSIDRFQQVLYWAELARHYMPPGLLPRETTGPRRLRAAGTTVEFPKAHEYPQFLLQLGEVDFAIAGDSPLRGAYAAAVRGLTSAPALYGRPMTITAHRRAAGAPASGMLGAIDVDAVLDHVGARPRDSVAARLQGVPLPRFDLPGVPFAVAPGVGALDLHFALRGDQLAGRWAINADRVIWSADSANRRWNELERLVWRVVSGVQELQVAAEMSGPVAHPRLAVRTNLDDMLARRLQAVLGEELAKAERLARAKVDSLVADKVAPLERQVVQVRDEATARVDAEQRRLDETRQRLEAELKRLAGPVGGVIQLPKIPSLSKPKP
jgi:uncharacterized protein (TIGR03545 family)